ncbi:SGNH/GDSL hydrolase family protein [Alicyclobacillaceae bacterium I2511]|nr:SGNH/GDSL hydrolase family protein [Alicyclobacillaceae bacterium I2511]
MFLYTALGDSITAGEGATAPIYAYPSRVVQILRSHGLSANGTILAQPGWTSADLEAAVFDNSLLPLAQAQAITVWVGADDLVHAASNVLRGVPFQRAASVALKRYTRDLALLLTTTRKLCQNRLIVCTQYNPFPNSPLAVEAVGALNTAIIQTASLSRCSVAPVAEWFRGRQNELIAGYRTGRLEDALHAPTAPVHPNNRGHALIAQGLVPLLHIDGIDPRRLT